MRRDDIDLHTVKPEHVVIHERLENWSRWQEVRGGGMVLPMFKFYRDGYHELAAPGVPVDERDAVKVQVAFSNLPERHRHAAGWAYAKPWIPVHRVCRVLAVNRRDLVHLLHDSRSMLKNTCAALLTVGRERV